MKNSIIKKLVCVLMITGMLLSVSLSAYAESASCGWFIKRNGSLQPHFPEETVNLREYGVYYMDTSLNDSSDEKKIYITFDFGYENGNVEKIANCLREENVPAAFFLLDYPILKNTELILQLIEDGHIICNHTKKHKDITGYTTEQIKSELSALEDIYREKTGHKMSKYFRYPEGKYSISSLKSLKELGYKTFFWSFAYDDWDNTNQKCAEQAIKKIINNTHNGAVMLFHPTSSTNAEIFPILIKKWRELGYDFGTLDELVRNVDASK